MQVLLVRHQTSLFCSALTLHMSPMLSPQNGINVLQAAAFATQAALNNPALQPILMAGSNPWLNPIYQTGNVMGLVNPSAAANPAAAAAALANAQLAQVPSAHMPAPGTSPPMLDPSTLSAAAQYAVPLAQQGGSGRVASEGLSRAWRRTPSCCFVRLGYTHLWSRRGLLPFLLESLVSADRCLTTLLQGMGIWSAGG